MLLYLFHYANILLIPEGPDEDAYTYIDDITLTVVTDTFKKNTHTEVNYEQTGRGVGLVAGAQF